MNPSGPDSVSGLHRGCERYWSGIEARPEMYGVAWQDVRAVRLRPFRHVLYYVVFTDRVEVLAVLHGAREPSAWQRRA